VRRSGEEHGDLVVLDVRLLRALAGFFAASAQESVGGLHEHLVGTGVNQTDLIWLVVLQWITPK
jgi:hypothetical protein